MNHECKTIWPNKEFQFKKPTKASKNSTIKMIMSLNIMEDADQAQQRQAKHEMEI